MHIDRHEQQPPTAVNNAVSFAAELAGIAFAAANLSLQDRKAIRLAGQPELDSQHPSDSGPTAEGGYTVADLCSSVSAWVRRQHKEYRQPE